MTTLDDIRAYLVTAGVISGTWKCTVGFMPDDGDQHISLIYTGGFPQDTMQGENLHQTFQVMIRASEHDHPTCEAKWFQVFGALQDAAISGIYLIQAMATGPLTFHDDKNRIMMSVNFRLIRSNA